MLGSGLLMKVCRWALVCLVRWVGGFDCMACVGGSQVGSGVFVL